MTPMRRSRPGNGNAGLRAVESVGSKWRGNRYGGYAFASRLGKKVGGQAIRYRAIGQSLTAHVGRRSDRVEQCLLILARSVDGRQTGSRIRRHERMAGRRQEGGAVLAYRSQARVGVPRGFQIGLRGRRRLDVGELEARIQGTRDDPPQTPESGKRFAVRMYAERGAGPARHRRLFKVDRVENRLEHVLAVRTCDAGDEVACADHLPQPAGPEDVPLDPFCIRTGRRLSPYRPRLPPLLPSFLSEDSGSLNSPTGEPIRATPSADRAYARFPSGRAL